MADDYTTTPGPSPNTVRAADGKVPIAPESRNVRPRGDAALPDLPTAPSGAAGSTITSAAVNYSSSGASECDLCVSSQANFR